MSLHDLQQRTDVILKKYERYDAPMNKRRGTKGDDPFEEEYELLEATIDDLNKQAEETTKEKNRAIVAQRNAELRKAKQGLLTEGVEVLQKKIKKGKGVTKAIIDERQLRVKAVIEKIYAIPDGMGGTRRPTKLGASITDGGAKSSINLSTSGPSGLEANPLYYKHTEETQKFSQEWEHAKKRQDMQLERIERGVSTLADMAKGMQEELDKQNPVVDDIDTQLNRVTSKLKNNNEKLKGMLTQMRSSRNFCIDIILLCVLMGIGAYLVTLLKKKE